MIAKTEWFGVRKYSGWGFSITKWQGGLYIFLITLPYFLLTVFIKNSFILNSACIIWSLIILIDLVPALIRVKADEREKIHEAIANRNAMWFVLVILIAGMMYQIITKTTIDPILLVILFGAAIVKSATHFYLRDK